MEDPHLLQSGGLAPITLPDGQQTRTVLLPFAMDGKRLGVRSNPPKLGEHSMEILRGLGYNAEQAGQLAALHVDAASPPAI
jgi:crotonobetainyl-CoA:carnitine CoA-transferase CaiB-like acyl-CoA transferase